MPEESKTVDHALADKRIFILDREPVLLMLFSQALIRYGLQVIGTESDGERGQARILEEKPDILLLDLDIDDFTGWQIAQKLLRKIPVCIVTMSTHQDLTELQQGSSAGIRGFVQKPVGFEDLLKTLTDAYRGYFLQAPEEIVLIEHDHSRP